MKVENSKITKGSDISTETKSSSAFNCKSSSAFNWVRPAIKLQFRESHPLNTAPGFYGSDVTKKADPCIFVGFRVMRKSW